MSLLRTPLYDWHVAQGGRMVEFGGWEMPVQYTSIVEEHPAVRRAAGLFDISHMGRLSFRGPQSEAWLGRLLTCRVDNLAVGQIRYSLVCRDDGGILDDVLVYRADGGWGLVVNAGNRNKIVSWIEQHQSTGETFDDQTQQTGMLAIQGPRAREILQQLTQTNLSEMKYYTFCAAEIAGSEVSLSRTGYTGEDGFELIAASGAQALAEKIFEAGQDAGLKLCGLGARDTLRLEAAMPLYGHELTEEIDPFTAGLDFAVKLDKSDFLGKAALQQRAQAIHKQRIGLQLAGKRIAREGASVISNGEVVGAVTSGTFSPTLEKSIAMAIVPRTVAAPGTPLIVDIRGKQEPAQVVSLPFYRRPKVS